MGNKSILIISYTFPPNHGIGGRRWAKFSKYLALKGYDIHVICAKNITKDTSFWAKEVLHENIHIHPLPIKYPKVLIKSGSDLFEKAKFQIWKIVLTVFSGGVVFERSLFWKKQLLNKALAIINENKIKNVVVTIPPYRLAYYAVSLKKMVPGINLLVDFRDPWTNNLSFHGFKNISPKRLLFEKKMELEVLKHSDKIVTVADNTTNYLKEQLNSNAGKFFTITNGFDPSDMNTGPIEIRKDKITFIHMGTLYPNLEYVTSPLLEFLSKLKNENIQLFDTLNFEFYGDVNLNFKKQIEEKKLTCFSINKSVTLADAFKKIKTANCCLLFAAPDHGFALNTKFCEYIGAQKPIILFSNGGEASEFIEKNKIGKSISPISIQTEMMGLFNCIQNGEFKFNQEFNTEQFSVIKLTEHYEELFV